jgi:hypothetical protein
VLAADSPDEVIAFAIAAIRKAKPEVRFFLEARTLIVDNEDAARLLAGRPNLTFLPRAQARQNAGLLAKSSPTLVAIGGDQPNRNYDVLARPSTSVMGKAISTMVNSEERGYELARSCGRSVTILARLIPGGAAALPEWINQGRVLLPALLAGGWTTNSAEDEEIVRSLAGARSYAEFEATLRPLTRLQDPPIDRVQDVWKIRAPVDAFVHLGHLIGADDLDRLREAATAVFSQIEELPNPNELFQLSPKAPKGHSEWLRDGLATTLLQIATLHSQARLVVPGSTPQQYVDEIVRSLPGLSSDHRLLASLGNQLPLLAEAAPDPLLSALELMLGGEGDAIKPIFNETKHVLVPRSAHTGLLWALETLAWDPALLRRVSLVLARLANIDPGGRLGNRPINSLREIFVSWSPNTNASLRQRLAALDYVIPRVPSVAWELVVNLFPKSHDTSMPTAKPKFRESGASDKEALTYGVVWEGHRQIISRALDLAADDPERLAVIITAFGDFEPDLRARTLEIVDAYLARAAKHDHRKVWSALRDEANRNRAYPDAEWSLPQDELARLDAIVQNRQPENLIDRVSWLFDDWTPDLPGPADERINLVETERRAAVQHVLTSQGIDGVLSFAERVKLPQFVAVALVELTNDPEICERVISGALDRSDQIERFADTISGAAARKFGDVWVQRFKRLAARKGWSPETIVSLILTWPDERRTWEMVAQFGTETEESYWRQKYAFIPQGDFDDLEFVAHRYMHAGRPSAALDALYTHVADLPVDLVFSLLDGAIKEFNSQGTAPNSMFVYHLEKVFDNLVKRENVPAIEIARREYAYLPLFVHRKKTLTLHRMMAESPEFYVSVISDVFREASAEADNPSEEKRQRARAGYNLLSSFKTLPGAKDGDLDFDVLKPWAEDVRRRAAEADRARITDQYIGHILAYAPCDKTDNAWPDCAVRQLLEELDSDEIERGLMIERFNMRGAHFKGAYEGGAQERVLAKQYRAWAKSMPNWPRTTAILEKIAAGWDHQASQEDIRAEQDKMKD